MAADAHSSQKSYRGLIVGELLLAVLLLAVAVSSLAALMYSVSHRTEARQEGRQSTTACVGKGVTAAGNCAPRATSGGGAKLLRSPCVTEDGTPARGCNDAVGNSEATILKTRTDSASIALVAKRQKPADRTTRPDRGFIR
ncbi:MAG: hypothetical protein ACR2NS_09390 [Gemmatimonadaceae bacterium]